MIAKIPVVLGEDVAEEETRSLAIDDLRNVIAHRWLTLFRKKTMLPEPDFLAATTDLSACIASLVEQNLDEIPFAPDMKDIVPAEVIERVPIQQGNSPNVSSSRKSVAASSCSSTRMCIPHEFRWVEMGQGVWTALKAVHVGQNKLTCK